MKYTIFSALATLVLCSLALNSLAKDTIELDEARFIFEVNYTDGDIGVQLILDS